MANILARVLNLVKSPHDISVASGTTALQLPNGKAAVRITAAAAITPTSLVTETANGRILFLQGTSNTNTITLTQGGNLAGLRAPTRVLGANEYIFLYCYSAVWYELFFSAGDVSETELGFLDGVTAGTAAASKALVLDSSSNVTSFGIGGVTILPRNVGTWANNTATSGTDTACTNGTAYVGSVFLGANARITGVQYLIGSVGGTDSVIASLHDSAGTLLANSALAGATVGTAAQLQQVALTATYDAKGPAWYFLALTFNGATAKFRSVPAYCNAGSGVRGNGVAQTFGTAATFTAPTTFTADKVPVASLY